MIPSVLLPGYVLMLGCAAFVDTMSLRLPNALTLSVAVLALVSGLFPFQPLDWWGSHVGAGLIVLVAGMAMFAWGKIGGGDVKLMAAVGMWHGLAQLPALLATIGVMGGIVSVAFLLLRQYGFGLVLAAYNVNVQSLESGKGVPYGIAIVAGSLLLLGLGA